MDDFFDIQDEVTIGVAAAVGDAVFRTEYQAIGILGLRSTAFCDERADFVLEREHVGNFAIISLRPYMLAGSRIDELRVYADAISRTANAALDHITCSELAAHALEVDVAPPVLEARVPRDDGKCPPARQARNQVFRESSDVKY